jgi:hypothetical protein
MITTLRWQTGRDPSRSPRARSLILSPHFEMQDTNGEHSAPEMFSSFP